MGRYLQLAERAMKVGVPSVPPAACPPQPHVVSEFELHHDHLMEQAELWEERAAIMEVEAGLPRELAEAHAAVPCQPRGAHEPLEVGSRCPVCARHLYVIREGRLWCVRCLRKGLP
jgi:hypothetical protein